MASKQKFPKSAIRGVSTQIRRYLTKQNTKTPCNVFNEILGTLLGPPLSLVDFMNLELARAIILDILRRAPLQQQQSCDRCCRPNLEAENNQQQQHQPVEPVAQNTESSEPNESQSREENTTSNDSDSAKDSSSVVSESDGQQHTEMDNSDSSSEPPPYSEFSKKFSGKWKDIVTNSTDTTAVPASCDRLTSTPQTDISQSIDLEKELSSSGEQST